MYAISTETLRKHVYTDGRLTYFGTCSARLRALIGLDLLIVVHLYRVSEARICPRVFGGTEDRDRQGSAINSM